MSDSVRTHETFTFTAADDTAIAAYRWLPDGPPRGIVQITHGMGEHMLRYAGLATALTARGFVVQGQDHRGHGATAGSPDRHGVLGETGWAGLVDDIDVLVGIGRDTFPGVPVVLLGHSMGSFAVQQYLPGHSDRVDAVVLSGTGLLDLLEPALDLSGPLDLSSFNAPFEDRTGYEWLSRDTDQVDLYVADERCGFGLDTPGTVAMFTAARPLADEKTLAAIRDDLPVYITVGDADPVNAGLALVDPMPERYRAAGLTDVTLTVWPSARHEVFNETNRDEIVADLLAWLDRVVPERN